MLAKLEYKILIISLAFQKVRKIDFKKETINNYVSQ